MKTFRWLSLISIVALTLALFGPAPVVARAETTEPGEPGEYMPGEVIVTYGEGVDLDTSISRTQALAGEVQAEVVKVDPGMALLRFPAEADVAAMVDRVKGYEGVAAAEPNYSYSIPELSPSEPYMESEVQLHTGQVYEPRSELGETTTVSKEELLSLVDSRMINGKITAVPQWPSDEALSYHFWRTDNYLVWVDAASSPGVCVVDTGADVAHPDLATRVVNGYDFVYMDSVPEDDNGHGTHVAGIIAAKMNNGADTAMGMSRSKVYAVKALNYNGYGTSYDLAQSITWCANNSAVKIINISWGSYSASYTLYNALYYAIKTKGKFVAAAAGNDNTTSLYYPAAYASPNTAAPAGSTGAPTNSISHVLVAVAASTNTATFVDTNNDGGGEVYFDCKATFSNYGAWVDIIAPGVDIYSTTPVSYPFKMGYYDGVDSGYASLSGTSMATPIVAAAAARTWSATPSYTNSQVNSRMWYWSRLLTAVEDPDNVYPTGAVKFCWPNTMKYSSGFISFAGVMGRGGLYINTKDGATGMPVVGSSVRAVNPAGTVKDTAITDFAGMAYLINLPYTNSGAPLYSVQVSKAGYTNGFTTVLDKVSVPLWEVYASIRSIIPMVNTRHYAVTMAWGEDINLDFRLFTPATCPDAGFVDYNQGILGDRPYIRAFMDGGNGDNPNVSAVVIRPKTGTNYPWYYTYGNYTILVKQRSGSVAQFNDADPVVRVWYQGKVKKIIYKDDICAVGDLDWLAGTIRTTVTEIDVCGVNLAPYAVDEGVYSIDGQ